MLYFLLHFYNRFKFGLFNDLQLIVNTQLGKCVRKRFELSFSSRSTAKPATTFFTVHMMA